MPAAYDAFLRGWDHYRRTTPDENAQAIPYFEEAIRLDPRYWRAYAAIALIYVRSLYFEEAIKQDPSYGHAALALIYLKGTSRQWTVRLAASRDEVFARARKYLQVVKEHPTSTARQAAGLVFAYSDNNDAAIGELKEAIALDPGDSWTYAYLAFVLLGAGRPAEAASFIETAMRVDPHAPPVFMYYRALAHFGMDEFEDAVASLESVTKLNPDDQWPFVILAATYGHLGRKQEAMSAIARFNGLSVEQGGIPLTIHTTPTAGLGRPADKARLVKGLRLAGVPEFISGGDFGAQNKLTADEIQLLLFGHRLHGRNLTSGYEHAAGFTPDGAVTISGNWGSGVGRIARFDGDNVCFDWSGYEQCATLFRNPGGTKEKENEFIWFDSSGAFSFSQAD